MTTIPPTPPASIPSPDDTTVVPFPRKTDGRQSEKKWSKLVLDRGYTILPSILLWGQWRLGLSPELLNVLLQMISHWWEAEEEPFPSKTEIGRRMGKSPRQVQRYLKDLEDAGFIQRIARMTIRGQTSNKYSLEGLVAKLKAIEPDFRRATEEGKKLRTEAETPVRKRGKRLGASPVA